MRITFLLLLSIALMQAKPTYWNQFRGPNGDGDAQNSRLPIELSESKNLTWKTPIPGKAWSSPVVKDGKVWITNAEEDGYKMCVRAWFVQYVGEKGEDQAAHFLQAMDGILPYRYANSARCNNAGRGCDGAPLQPCTTCSMHVCMQRLCVS